MKRFIIIILSVLLIGGIGYLGYMIFNSKSVVDVEIVGDIQTIYIANECIEPDFQDAELKVTYKNGKVKLMKLTNKKVDVKYFSTSVADHKTMTITYKSFDMDVEYDVVNNGLFYLSSETLITSQDYTVPTPTTFNQNSAPVLFYFGEEGELEYYYRQGSKTYMHDGSYDKSYRYIVENDEIKIYLGSDEVKYRLKSNYNSEGTTSLKYENVTSTNLGVMSSKEIKTFKFYEHFKTDRRISTISLDFSNTSGYILNPSDYEESVVKFYVNQTIKSSGKIILLKVVYSNDSFMKTVYVNVSDEMIVGSSFVTTYVTDIGYMTCAYEGRDFTINYKVLNS